MTESKTVVHNALTELLLDGKLHLKSDELVVSATKDLVEAHGVDIVREWRDESRKHKHSIIHILVNFNKQIALSRSRSRPNQHTSSLRPMHAPAFVDLEEEPGAELSSHRSRSGQLVEKRLRRGLRETQRASREAK